MDHLLHHFGDVVNVAVPCLLEDREDTCCLPNDGLDAEAPFQHGSQYHDFLNFPSSHGWKVEPDTYLLSLDRGNGQAECLIDGADQFVQSWLFFCLLTVVVRTDEPLLNMCDLVRWERQGPDASVKPQITTKDLEQKLTQWHEWMKENPTRAKLRLMQTDLVLEFARQVVRENLDEKKRANLEINARVSLSIMVLGETLSAVKSSMLREMDERILGWESDDLNGWGCPSHVMDIKPDACAYTRKALKRQIGPNATLLLAAWKHCTWHKGEEYECSETECKYIKVSPPVKTIGSAADAATTDANTAHANYVPRCACRRPCRLVGPKMEDVYNILRKRDASFPVFEVGEARDNKMSVVVKDWGQHQQNSAFATISHVWSQGLGNPKSNEVHSWMRRLWTLQEAFLSKAMCFPEQAENGNLRAEKGRYPGRGFDQLIQDLGPGGDTNKPTILKVSLAEVLKRHLFENLMGRERGARIEKGNPFGDQGSQLIASAWRSARWRDTSHKEDETIILSTLLNLDFRDTTLDGPTRHKDPKTQDAIEQRKEMMKDFLQLISKHCPGSIPAGIIFLPGKRLKLPGFGWAPATWTSGRNEDYPYPLSRMEHPTELVPEGLLVRYPGIMLHCEKLATVTSQNSQGFHFPVDRELNEWYRVDLINENTLPKVADIEAGRTGRVFNYMLAVIISRPRPKERLRDVGLLVEIYESSWRRHERQVRNENIFYSRILSRVHISRVGPVSWREPSDQVIGERTREDQLWCVDDFTSNKTRFEELAAKKKNRRGNGDKAKPNTTALKDGILNVAGSAPGNPPPIEADITSDHDGSANVMGNMGTWRNMGNIFNSFFEQNNNGN
ncbi:uncharacterized protein PG986_008720 [Apiospora aurea]|uniref:Uncharacterized protein n=1 Tax=Apiospora aurea TaxID=335848 RepID=A0ABR1Q631_9PEZI